MFLSNCKFIAFKPQFKHRAAVLAGSIALMASVTGYARGMDGPVAAANDARFQRATQDANFGGGFNGSRARFDVVQTFTGITTPHGVNVMPLQKKLWVTNNSAGTASRIDIGTGQVEMAVPVGLEPDLIITDKLRQKVWITNLGDNTVSVLNANTGEELDRIPVGNEPHGLAVDQARGMVYVANYKDNTVFMFDARTNEKLGSITVGKGPRNIVLDAFTGNIFVTNMEENTVSLVNPQRGREIARMAAGAKPVGIDFNMLTRALYVSNAADGTVSVFRNGRQVKTINVGPNPRGIQINILTNQVFVNVAGESTVAVIDGFSDRIRQKLQVGERNYVASLDITSNTLYVANQDSDSISVISAGGNFGTFGNGMFREGFFNNGPLPGFFDGQNGGGIRPNASMDVGEGIVNR